jgi:hypothetical protein
MQSAQKLLMRPAERAKALSFDGVCALWSATNGKTIACARSIFHLNFSDGDL